MTTLIKGQQVKLSPDVIHVAEKKNERLFHNPRLTFDQDDLDSLRESIASLGLMKPLLVRPLKDKEGHFELIAGERRLRCIKQLLKDKAACFDIETNDTDTAQKIYKHVPVVVINPKSDFEQLQYAIAENLESAPVPDWEMLLLCLAMSEKVDEKGQPVYTRDQLCKAFGKSQTWISHTLSLTQLPDSAKIRLRKGTLSRTAAIHLLQADPKKMEAVLAKSEQIVRDELNNELALAEEQRDDAELAAQIAEEQAAKDLQDGEYMLAKIQERTAVANRKRASVAQTKIGSVKKQQEKNEIPAEAVDRALDEMPEALQEGAVKKARSPKFLRNSCEGYAKLLETSKTDVVKHELSGDHPRAEVELVLLGVQWALGHGGACLLEMLKNHRQSSTKRKRKS